MANKALITDVAKELGNELPDGGAIIGIDLGTKTIGLSVSDRSWRYATPLQTINRGKFKDDSKFLKQTIEERKISAFVVGLPKNMDGSEGSRAQSARAYAKNLSETFALPSLMWDERWSTQSAQNAMIEQEMTRSKRGKRIDSHAAAIILQGALDALTGNMF
jgi:putative Holliday junction resolvase